MDAALKQYFDDLVKKNDVVLFMKGNPQAPQCGFSAQVVRILGEYLPAYESVNVLADPAVRDGIKEYSDWPTIPQLYVKGEFVGGCDIVKDLYAKGELSKMLGVKEQEVVLPAITITDAAKAALLSAQKDAGGEPLHLNVNDRFDSALDVGPREPHELEISANGVVLYIDKPTAKRTNGLKIDFVQGPQGAGFKIENPNAPPRVKQIAVKDLKALLDQGRPIQLFDVRGPDEHKVAHIKQARLLDEQALQDIGRMAKDTPLYFHCHHGGRSQRAAEQFLAQGYKNVHNVAGGIDAWSQEIDSSVPRY
ncbi:MAG: Grx4 family monothiol glutaredoxin [Deltaproteobacteria bacterium]|nr:Grx4 family monothiol glutaredoxin [Deltaproteobacteria bacterium]